MDPSSQPDPEVNRIRDAAARWIVRRDRGLSAAESIEFELWLASDPRHAAALQCSAEAWKWLDRVPDAASRRVLTQAAQRRRRFRLGLALGGLAAAAAIAVLLVGVRSGPDVSADLAPALLAAGPRSLTLADGTLVRLNTGGEVIEEFSPAERRVRLTRGEAHFTVTPHAERPFVVLAGAVRVRAVGTAFNVNLQATRVEVLVTEGSVRVVSGAPTTTEAPLVAAGQRAVLPAAGETEAAPVRVTPVDDAEIARALAWHESLVRLGGATLAELAREFERRSGQRVVIGDPELAQMRMGGRFRGDDLDGFAHLLATAFDVDMERMPDGSWVLRKKKSPRDSGR